MHPPGELIPPSSRFAILQLSPLGTAAIHRKREQPEEKENILIHVLRPRHRNAACHLRLPSTGTRK